MVRGRPIDGAGVRSGEADHFLDGASHRDVAKLKSSSSRPPVDDGASCDVAFAQVESKRTSVPVANLQAHEPQPRLRDSTLVDEIHDLLELAAPVTARSERRSDSARICTCRTQSPDQWKVEAQMSSTGTRTCSWCGEEGHDKRSCGVPPNAGACSVCGYHGHDKRNCPRK